MNKKIQMNKKRKKRMVPGCRKSFILSLDIAVASFLVVLLLAFSQNIVKDSERDYVSELKIVRTGSDIITLLDYENIIDSMDSGAISNEMYELLPAQYNMLIRVMLDDSSAIYAGGDAPTDRFVGTGKRYFVIIDGQEVKNAGVIDYWIWLR